MGFWGDLWNSVKSVAGQVYNTVKKPIDFVASLGDYAKKIPLIGNTVSTVLTPITGLAKTVQGGLGVAKDVADVGKALGLQRGGMVPMKKVYQA
jgi:hypothetical protein